MNMEIKLLDNKKGFILTRQPEIVKDELLITFSGAPEKATAIFESSQDSLYRALSDGCCSVPESFLEGGEIKITVTVLDGTARPPKWTCEGIKATKLKSGSFVVCPNDMDLPQKVVEIQLEMQKIREKMEVLLKSYSELDTKLKKLLEGYDIT